MSDALFVFLLVFAACGAFVCSRRSSAPFQCSLDRFRADARNPVPWIVMVAMVAVFFAFSADQANWPAMLFAVAVVAAFMGACSWFTRRR